jgi:hypothetical protein
MMPIGSLALKKVITKVSKTGACFSAVLPLLSKKSANGSACVCGADATGPKF